MVDDMRVIPPGVLIIGSSGHGRDIASTITHHRMIDHHSEWAGQKPYIIGINDPQVRAKVAADLGGPGLTWIHPTAYVGTECTIGEDTHINYGVKMTRTVIGKGCTLCPSVTIGGDVTIGDRVFVGMGAVIGVPHAGEKITIGDDAVIGAGAVVLSDVPKGETWVGVPARAVHP